MLAKFENEISVLTRRSTTVGIEEFLLDHAKRKALSKAWRKPR